MKFSAQQIADMLGGRVEGNADTTVSNLSKIEEGKIGTLSFLANLQYQKYIYETEASIVIVGNDFNAERAIKATLIRVAEPYKAFSKLLEAYDSLQHQKSGIHPRAIVADTASLGENVYLAAGVVIEDGVKIGNNTKIYANCVISENCSIGENCLIFSSVTISNGLIGNRVTLHSGVIIGADGFGFAPQGSGYDKVAQIGNVVIEDDVEIGANTAIDRATLGSTIIRSGVKLDNLIQVAHNVEIGKNTVIAAQSGIAGSSKIGENCMIGGQVGISGHVKIGNGVKIAAQSGVAKDIADNSILQGSPAFNVSDYQKSYVYFRKLPSLIRDLEKKLKNQ
jgi:UDP-3-O-[3-hydroxymyristoyl] glucosamine N-acyltransferase